MAQFTASFVKDMHFLYHLALVTLAKEIRPCMVFNYI